MDRPPLASDLRPHRKRVQRSQKIKELRAKHFAKVAADRARAVPHASRSSSALGSRQVRWLSPRRARGSSCCCCCRYNGSYTSYGRQVVVGGHILLLASNECSQAVFTLCEVLGEHGGTIYERNIHATYHIIAFFPALSSVGCTHKDCCMQLWLAFECATITAEAL